MGRLNRRTRQPGKKGAPRQIGSAIESVLKELKLGPKIKQYSVLEVWPKAVGDKIAAVASAESIKNGKLIVKVANSTWRNELVYLKRELISRINREMGEEIVTDIIFK